jgi:DNA (cytosine-5)-methyltransferase 1
MSKLKVLDLFSGIGGFSLGLERTGGFETVAFCEIGKFPQRVLAKHWPGIKIYEDVRNVTADQLSADGIECNVITGGFPCQDLSTAGKQAGIDGERSGLWSQVARIICEIRPQFAVMENVAALLSGDNGRWFGRVLRDLAEIGYCAEWHCIPASYVGAPHIRDRVWIISYPNAAENSSGPIKQIFKINTMPGGNCESPWRTAMPKVSRVGNGLSGGLDARLGSLGNSVVPQIPEIIGHAILKSLEAA